MPKATFVSGLHLGDSTLFLVLSDGTRVGRGESADFSDSDFLTFSRNYILDVIPDVEEEPAPKVETSPKKSGARTASGNDARKAVN